VFFKSFFYLEIIVDSYAVIKIIQEVMQWSPDGNILKKKTIDTISQPGNSIQPYSIQPAYWQPVIRLLYTTHTHSNFANCTYMCVYLLMFSVSHVFGVRSKSRYRVVLSSELYASLLCPQPSASLPFYQSPVNHCCVLHLRSLVILRMSYK
jgi:hypothetical protein